MNIHKCDEAARWKAEVLQMMWARAKDHAAGPSEAKDPTPMGHSALDTTLFGGATPGCWMGCHGMPSALDAIPFGGVTLSGCHLQPSDATPTGHWPCEHPHLAELVPPRRPVAPCRRRVLEREGHAAVSRQGRAGLQRSAVLPSQDAKWL